MYEIEWKRGAVKELKRLPEHVVSRVYQAVDELARNPYPSGVVKLSGSERTYRIRVGDYRVIYTVEERILLIEIIRVRHRRDAYR